MIDNFTLFDINTPDSSEDEQNLFSDVKSSGSKIDVVSNTGDGSMIRARILP